MRYVADDDTEFSTEKECLEYEEKQNKIKKCFALYNTNFDNVSLDDLHHWEYIDILSDWENVKIYIGDYSGWRNGIVSNGVYRLNYDGYWESVSELVNDYRDKMNKMAEALHTIETIRELKRDLPKQFSENS